MTNKLAGKFRKKSDRIKVIAFDFWGVFADLDHPMYSYMKSKGVDAEKYSHQIHDLIIEHDLGELTEKQFIEKTSEIVGIDMPYNICRLVFKEELMNRKLEEIVKKLKKKYKVILLSNNSKEYCQEYLFKTELNKLFDDLIISYDVKHRKPAKEIYQILIERAKVKPEEILFIDDGGTKFPPAEKLGIKTLQYKRKTTDKILKELAK